MPQRIIQNPPCLARDGRTSHQAWLCTWIEMLCNNDNVLLCFVTLLPSITTSTYNKLRSSQNSPTWLAKRGKRFRARLFNQVIIGVSKAGSCTTVSALSYSMCQVGLRWNKQDYCFMTNRTYGASEMRRRSLPQTVISLVPLSRVMHLHVSIPFSLMFSCKPHEQCSETSTCAKAMKTGFRGCGFCGFRWNTVGFYELVDLGWALLLQAAAASKGGALPGQEMYQVGPRKCMGNN